MYCICESEHFWKCSAIDANDAGVLFYVFGIGLGLLMPRMRGLTDDTFFVSDEEAQHSRLAQRSRRVPGGRTFILNPSVHPRHM